MNRAIKSSLVAVCILGLLAIAACSEKEQPETLEEHIALAREVEVNFPGDSCVSYYQAALRMAVEVDSVEAQMQIHNVLAVKYIFFEEEEKAAKNLRSTLSLGKNHPQYHEEIALALDWYGAYHLRMQNYDSGLYYFEKGLAYGLEHLEPTHQAISNSYLSIAFYYANTRRFYDKAIENLQKSIAIRTALFGKNSGEVGECLLNLAKWHYEQADYHKAIDYMEKALRSFESVTSSEGIAVTIIKMYLGNYYRSAGELEKSIDIYDDLINTRENAENQLNLAKARLGLAMSLAEMNNSNAENLFLEAVAKVESLYEAESRHFVLPYHETGKYYLSLGSYDKAEEYLNKCLELSEILYGQGSVYYGEVLLSLGELYLGRN
ncbi:MAG: tetratricopeptide repeat protein, partial [Cyclobacteriaceae bacterium]